MRKISTDATMWRRLFIAAVLSALVNASHGQSYFLTLSQKDYNLFGSDHVDHETNSQPNRTDTALNLFVNEEEDNSSLILIPPTAHEKSSELSQTAMDIITIVWYVATFLALAAFFMLMACSDRRCNDAQHNGANGADAPRPPPTPSPSYSEFAPPSYETVMKMQHAAKTSIFVIPFAIEDNKDGNNNANSSSVGEANTPSTPTTPAINYYTINELQKLGGS